MGPIVHGWEPPPTHGLVWTTGRFPFTIRSCGYHCTCPATTAPPLRLDDIALTHAITRALRHHTLPHRSANTRRSPRPSRAHLPLNAPHCPYTTPPAGWTTLRLPAPTYLPLPHYHRVCYYYAFTTSPPWLGWRCAHACLPRTYLPLRRYRFKPQPTTPCTRAAPPRVPDAPTTHLTVLSACRAPFRSHARYTTSHLPACLRGRCWVRATPRYGARCFVPFRWSTGDTPAPLPRWCRLPYWGLLCASAARVAMTFCTRTIHRARAPGPTVLPCQVA